MSKVIISDTSCFIALDKINQIEILFQIFDSVLTTPEVQQEFGKGLPSWVSILQSPDRATMKQLEKHLDVGEASAIALALSIKGIALLLSMKRRGVK